MNIQNTRFSGAYKLNLIRQPGSVPEGYENVQTITPKHEEWFQHLALSAITVDMGLIDPAAGANKTLITKGMSDYDDLIYLTDDASGNDASDFINQYSKAGAMPVMPREAMIAVANKFASLAKQVINLPYTFKPRDPHQFIQYIDYDKKLLP